MSDKVSYVVTVYNKADFLPDVLKSIAAEHRETGGEIIIVDDGSDDGSSVIVTEFAKANDGVMIITQPNAGVAAATNRGIDAASENYLRLVDGDDIIVPGSTRHLITALKTTGCGFAFGKFANGVLPDAPPPIIEVVADPLRRMLVRQPFVPATTLGVTAIMKQTLPLSPHFRTAQDFALGIKLAALTGFAETTAFCCVQPVISLGLSANKAMMFRETVLLTLELGEEQSWPRRYRQMAIGRNAGRARNYLRRHVEGRHGIKAGIGFLAIIAQISFFLPYRRLMIYIANAYNPSS